MGKPGGQQTFDFTLPGLVLGPNGMTLIYVGLVANRHLSLTMYVVERGTILAGVEARVRIRHR
jgi:hypothetical protein